MGTGALSAVILAGGAGTRFWPLSTERRPKQFLSLLGERTLLQASMDRLRGLVPLERTLVITGARFVELARAQLPELPPENVIGEPVRRDTAAAVALGALILEQRGGCGVMAVLTADHRIEPAHAFQAAVRSAARGARENREALYTFGIVPTYPATAYGYLHRGEPIAGSGDPPHFKLRAFVEKPGREDAEAYLSSGEYAWNSGMFVWSLDAIRAELERQLPQHLARLAPVAARSQEADFGERLGSALHPLAATSIDFGVMEHARDVRCVEASFEWSDVGGWLALAEFLASDQELNAFRHPVHTLDARRNIVFCAEAGEEVALVGVEGLVVVRAGNRTLVCAREQAEAIKQLVERLPLSYAEARVAALGAERGTSMRAAVIRELGNRGAVGIEVVPDPQPGPGEVLVEVRACGINFTDLLSLDGKYQNNPPPPLTPGKDAAGVVRGLGKGVRGLGAGDRVLAHVTYGGLAEQVVCPQPRCLPVPDAIDFETAAAFGLVYLTAYFALKVRGGLTPGQSVLVNGASGGVGLACLSLARAMGARRVLAGLTTPSKGAAARAAGADSIIDLTQDPLKDRLRDQLHPANEGKGVDLAVDLLGGAYFEAAMRSLATYGRIVVSGFAAGDIPSVRTNYLLLKNVSVVGMTLQTFLDEHSPLLAEAQSYIFERAVEGALDAHVTRRFPFERFLEAIEQLERRALTGKAVVTFD